MGSTSDSSNLKTLDYTGKHVPFPPPSFLPTSTTYSEVESKKGSFTKSLEGVNYHQRCSSESFLIEEQPSWLDDLLNDTETIFHIGHHRRSASDSYAYLEEAAEEMFTLEEESKYINSFVGRSTRSQNLMHLEDVDNGNYNETKADLLLAKKNIQETEEVVSSLAVDHSREESSSQNLEGDSADKAIGSQVKPSGSKADSKRSKQHNAHQSRVRKLQYISHLERTAHILKVNGLSKEKKEALEAEGLEVSAELEFLEQQNMILTMENRALRQRLESISQEQIIKHWEQGMLEREVGRLQNLYHMQKKQQMQLQNQQQPHNQHPKHRRNKSIDLDHQMNSALVKNRNI